MPQTHRELNGRAKFRTHTGWLPEPWSFCRPQQPAEIASPLQLPRDRVSVCILTRSNIPGQAVEAARGEHVLHTAPGKCLSVVNKHRQKDNCGLHTQSLTHTWSTHSGGSPLLLTEWTRSFPHCTNITTFTSKAPYASRGDDLEGGTFNSPINPLAGYPGCYMTEVKQRKEATLPLWIHNLMEK